MIKCQDRGLPSFSLLFPSELFRNIFIVSNESFTISFSSDRMTSSPISTCNEAPLKVIHFVDLHLDYSFRGHFAQTKRLHEHLSNATFVAFDSIFDLGLPTTSAFC